MADTKISALPSGNPAQSGDQIPIARSGANYKITAASIASLAGNVDGPASSVDNQIALFNSTTGKVIKAASTTGLLKASSGVIAAAVSGTDYAPATSGTSILKGSGTGGFSNAAAGTDYLAPPSGTSILKANSGGALANAVSGTDYAPATSGTSILYGNGSGGFSNVTVGSGLSFAAGTLSASGGGTTTNALTMNNSGSGASSGTTFDGSVARTISYNTVGAPSETGTNASGTWGISVTGNAATATSVAGGAANKIVYQSGSGTTVFIDAPVSSGTYLGWNGSAFAWSAPSGAGTVSSVALTMPTGFSVTGSPITSSGTFAVTTSLSGILKGTGSGFTTASAGTDYAAAPTGTNAQLLANNGSGGFSNVTVGTGLTYVAGTLSATGGGVGTVTSVDVSGGTTGLTTSGGPITTSGTITLAGTLAVANGGTGITSFGTGVATALGQNVTGSGGIALSTSPSFTTPTLGVASATSINKVAVTAPANSATLTLSDGSSLITSGGHALTFTTTGSTNVTLPTSGTLATTSNTVASISFGATGLTPSTTTTGAVTVSGTLAVANGGTGITSFGSGIATWLGTPSSANLAAAVSDETGTGALVFANTPTLVTPVLGTPTSGNLSNCTVDGTNKVGYIGAPQSTNTTVAASDAGKHIYFTGGSTATLTVNTNATTPIDIGTTILVVNNNSGNLTISGAGVTFQLANGATGNRTVATKGMATLLKVATDTWYVSGAGVT